MRESCQPDNSISAVEGPRPVAAMQIEMGTSPLARHGSSERPLTPESRQWVAELSLPARRGGEGVVGSEGEGGVEEEERGRVVRRDGRGGESGRGKRLECEVKWVSEGGGLGKLSGGEKEIGARRGDDRWAR